MAVLATRVTALAFLGKLPRDIEMTLSIEPGMITRRYQRELQDGYGLRKDCCPRTNQERCEILRRIHKNFEHPASGNKKSKAVCNTDRVS